MIYFYDVEGEWEKFDGVTKKTWKRSLSRRRK
jgi:hypothetical protein